MNTLLKLFITLTFGGSLTIGVNAQTAEDWNCSWPKIKIGQTLQPLLKEEYSGDCYTTVIDDLIKKGHDVGEKYRSRVKRNDLGYLADTWVAVGLEHFAFEVFEEEHYKDVLDGFKYISIQSPDKAVFGNDLDNLGAPDYINNTSQTHRRKKQFRQYWPGKSGGEYAVSYFWSDSVEQTRTSISIYPCSRVLRTRGTIDRYGRSTPGVNQKKSTNCMVANIRKRDGDTSANAKIVYHRVQPDRLAARP